MKTLTIEQRNKRTVKIINIVFTSIIGVAAIAYGAKAISFYVQHNHLFGW